MDLICDLPYAALDVRGDVDSHFGDIRDDRSLDDVLGLNLPWELSEKAL